MTDHEGKPTKGGTLEPPKESKHEVTTERDVFTAPTVVGQATEDILALVKAAADGAPRPKSVPPLRDPVPTIPAGALSERDVERGSEDAEERSWEDPDEAPNSQRVTLTPEIVNEGTPTWDDPETELSDSAPPAATAMSAKPTAESPTNPGSAGHSAHEAAHALAASAETDDALEALPEAPNGVAKVPPSAVETVAIRAVPTAMDRPWVFGVMVALVAVFLLATLVGGLLLALR